MLLRAGDEMVAFDDKTSVCIRSVVIGARIEILQCSFSGFYPL